MKLSLAEASIVAAVFILTGCMVVAAAKTTANTSAQCQGNLRKIGMAQAMHAAEHGNRLELNLYDLNPYLGFAPTDIPAVTGCPAVPPERRRKVFYGFEYGKNGYVLCPQKVLSSNSTSEKAENHLSSYPSPGKTMLYLDFPPEPTGGLGAVFDSSPWLKAEDPKGFRHESRSDILFMDGHVAPLSPQEVPGDSKTPFWSETRSLK